MNKRFVLSASEFKNISDAEKKVTAWWENGTLKENAVKLYEVVSVYDLKLKFIKVKENKK